MAVNNKESPITGQPQVTKELTFAAQFDRHRGSCYTCCFLMCCPPLFGCLFCGICGISRVHSQKFEFQGGYLRFTYNNCLTQEDRLIPLDRIQGVNIHRDLIARCCCTSTIEIETAARGEIEALLISPRDPEALRRDLMALRDENSVSTDGLGNAKNHGHVDSAPVASNNAKTAIPIAAITGQESHFPGAQSVLITYPTHQPEALNKY